jgi:hypothetical protein
VGQRGCKGRKTRKISRFCHWPLNTWQEFLVATLYWMPFIVAERDTVTQLRADPQLPDSMCICLFLRKWCLFFGLKIC